MIEKLRGDLDEVTRQKQLERKAAETTAMNMVDAASAISARLAPEQGQAELDETQPATQRIHTASVRSDQP